MKFKITVERDATAPQYWVWRVEHQDGGVNRVHEAGGFMMKAELAKEAAERFCRLTAERTETRQVYDFEVTKVAEAIVPCPGHPMCTCRGSEGP